MTSGRCVVLPVSLCAVGLMWLATVGLLTWGTFGGPNQAAEWGLMLSAAAAAGTVLYAVGRMQSMLDAAFRMGEESARHPRIVR